MDFREMPPALEQRRRAWVLTDQGLCSTDPAERKRLGREALEIHEDCSGAYLLLAEERLRSEPEEAVGLCERAVEAAERSLDASLDSWREASEGEFFHIPATKRYVEAVNALAHSLRAAGARDAAIERAYEVLELDSADHLGISHALLDWLVEQERDEEGWELIQRLPCPCPHHAYSRALLSFRAFGRRDRRAAWALRMALDNNARVPPYLTGERRIPRAPARGSGGDPFDKDTEAAGYARGCRYLWSATPGALGWLEDLSTDRDLLENMISPGPPKRWIDESPKE